jgi:DNA-binding phage protein
MALTRNFKEQVKDRAQRDPAFRRALIAEAIAALQAEEFDVAKKLIGDYVNATDGFKKLSQVTSTPEKSLMRMLGPNGNPTIANFFGLLSPLLAQEGLRLTIAPERNVANRRAVNRRQAAA